MPSTALDAQFKRVVTAAAAALKSHGYRKRGQDFYQVCEGNLALIAFQRSQWNDAETLRFTVNLSVISGALLRHRDPERELAKSKEYEGHLRERLGGLLPGNLDRWWTLASDQSAALVEAEVIDALVEHAVPFLAAHVRDADLIALWKSGRASGLTKIQLERNLAELERLV